MKSKILLGLTALGMMACSAAAANDSTYTITVNGDGNFIDGDMVYLLNYDTSEKIDSVVANDDVAVFKGIVTKPFVGRIVYDGKRMGTFVVEGGDVTVADGEAKGGNYNAVLDEFGKQMQALQAKYSEAKTEDDQKKILQEYGDFLKATFEKNADNPVGYLLFVDMATDMDRAELDSVLAKYPSLANYERVKKSLATFERQEATAPGKMFTDFEIEYDGKTTKLSDFVGKGKYTLVDFWASWCGPCRREAQGALMDIYNKYNGKGLDIVGIAVWDEPQNTLQAIDQMKLPWTQVLNGQNIPTDLYGILGIPCIILFDPDGRIVSRNLQDEELKASVDAAMAKYNAPAAE